MSMAGPRFQTLDSVASNRTRPTSAACTPEARAPCAGWPPKWPSTGPTACPRTSTRTPFACGRSCSGSPPRFASCLRLRRSARPSPGRACRWPASRPPSATSSSCAGATTRACGARLATPLACSALCTKGNSSSSRGAGSTRCSSKRCSCTSRRSRSRRSRSTLLGLQKAPSGASLRRQLPCIATTSAFPCARSSSKRNLRRGAFNSSASRRRMRRGTARPCSSKSPWLPGSPPRTRRRPNARPCETCSRRCSSSRRMRLRLRSSNSNSRPLKPLLMLRLKRRPTPLRRRRPKRRRKPRSDGNRPRARWRSLGTFQSRWRRGARSN
mmetsp:Transcript_1380/g.5086  ORF Transcript_1380/g.5086 Transcript_1380/m.5086 type:complete len:326 (-) Transcript_1380:515-1492(-)